MKFVLSLGSNIDPLANMQAALARLAALGTLERVSRFYQTAPHGAAQGLDPFVNAAVVLRTRHADLKPRLRSIEAALGRVRPAPPNAARTIDIDLVDPLDSATFDLPYLVVPLAEVAPELRHPRTGESVSVVAARVLSDDGGACAAL